MKSIPTSFCLFFILLSSICFSQVTTFPYFQNFDASSGGWSNNTIIGTAWELGIPTAPGTIGAHSSPNCWGTDLDSGYRVNSWSYLTSPKFYVSSLNIPYFSFYQFRYMSSGLDGMYIEYTTNDVVWNVLGAYNSPYATNWYNVSSLFSTGLPAFTGNSNTWIQSGINLSYLGSLDSIRFRFFFRSNLNFGSAQPGVFVDDIAVEEMPPPPIDVGVLSINSPGANVNNTSIYPITISIANYSTITVDTVYCYYSNNGSNSPVTAVAVNLLPFQVNSYTIGNYQFPTGPNALCVYVTDPNDINTSNDFICSQVISAPFISIPYFEDFENSNGNWYQTSFTTTNWEYGTPNYGSTTGAHSGIKCWDTSLDTGYSGNANAILYSPMFDLTGVPASRLSCWLNYRTESSWDGTRIEYSVDNDVTWQILGYLNDPDATNWYDAASINSSGLPAWVGSSPGWINPTYSLYQLIGQSNVRFRFIFTSDGSVNQDGISMDDFSIAPIPDYDIQLISVSTLSNAYPIGSTSDPIYFSVKNNGGLTITNFNFEYTVNGALQSNAVFNGNLPPGGSAQLTLPGYAVSQTNNLICGKINLVNDADTTDNFACTSLSGTPSFIPTWTDNFDATNINWYNENVSGALSNWELGQPAFGATSSTLSAPNSWDVNLNTAYTPLAHCRLYSPFFDLSNAVHPKIEFWQNRNTEVGWDGMRIEYKSNLDPNWYVLGIQNDVNGTNWYTSGSLISSNLPGWEGNSSGWTKCTYNLDAVNLGTLVQFRFVFTSDGAVVTDGISIDNFTISTIYSEDALLSSFISPGANSIQGASTPVEVILKNNGSQPISSLNIKYELNGGAPVSYSWSGLLLTDSSTIVSLPVIFPIAGTNTLKAYIDWPLDLYQLNDTISTTTFGIVTSGLPYSNDFENGSGGWQANAGPGNTNWELGQPAFPPLNSTHSGNACWDINLNAPYFNLANAVLTSPIFDLTPYNLITIQFWLNYASESGADGVFVEYTTNGNTWQRLGNMNDPAGINWYNSTLTSGNEGWCGVTTGWQSCSYAWNSPFGNNYLQLRFRFISDFNVVDAGASIDDINITGVTSLNEFDQNSTTLVFPNPTNDLLTIQYLNNASRLQRIELRSVEGQLVYVQEYPPSSQLKISTANFASGMYLLGIVNEQGEKSFKRVMIQH